MNLTSNQIPEQFIEAIPDPVVVIDREHQILAANSRAKHLFGHDTDTIVGISLGCLLTPVAGSRFSDFPESPVPAMLCRESGSNVPVSIIVSPVENGTMSVAVLKPIAAASQFPQSGELSVLETLSEGVLITSQGGSIVYLNNAARNMIGLPEPELPQVPVTEFFVEPSIISHVQPVSGARLADALSGNSAVSRRPALLRSSATTTVEVTLNAMPLDFGESGSGGAIVTFQNVTRQKHAELQIAIQKHVLDMIATGNTLEDTSALIVEYLERVIPGTCAAVYRIERESRMVASVSAPGVPEQIRDTLSESAGDPISSLCVHALISRQAVLVSDARENENAEDLKRVLLESGLRSVWCIPVDATAHRSMGVICLYRYTPGSPDDEAQSLIDTAAGLLRVALDRVQFERELHFQSFNDDLTGLPNRVLLMDRLDIALQRAAKSDDVAALLLLNIDRFRTVNSSLGLTAGDAVLRETARRLRSCVRSDDLVARFTGDTFGVLLTNITSETDAINVVMRIQRTFATPVQVSGVEHYVSLSIGIALPTEPDDSADTMIRYADIALNRAKNVGMGQFAIFSPARDLSSVPRIELQSRLHRALAADALELHYQPVVSLQDRGVAGYEALVRWSDQQFGSVPPEEFLPLAQQAGIMAEITSWVLDRAVLQLVDWHKQHGSRLFAAVNISPSEMNHSLLVEQVEAVLKRYDLDPGCLVLEMTEHALLDTSGQPRAILDRLRELGVRVALDDFGTGYSSLSYLEQLNVDAIKIDRAFIQAARGGASRAPVASAMVDLARKLGMISVAEGIETIEDERVARQLGCDFSQGYLYGRPQPAQRLIPRPGAPPLSD